MAWILTGALGCAGSLPTTHYYTLGPPAELEPAAESATADGNGLIVGVESFAVDPPYDRDRLVFRRGADSTEVGFYAYHRWAAPLGRMVALAVSERLRGTPGVASIEPATAAGEYSALLGGRVLYIEEVDLPSGPMARVAIAFELADSTGEIRWAETISASESGEAAEGGEVAHLIREAFDEALGRARDSLTAALAR